MSNHKNSLLALLVVITAAALLFAVSTGASSRSARSVTNSALNNVSMAGGGGTTFNYTGTTQTYTVPPGVTSINIDGTGAQGGSVTTTCSANGGRGARMIGDFAVTPGEVLTIVVGQQGFTNGSDAGGGGGTYVVRTGNVPLLVAGGGGGATNNIGACGPNRDGADASLTTSGTASGDGLEEGGIGGNGGGASSGSGGGGGGFLTDGVAGTGHANNNGKSYLSGSAGGEGVVNDSGGYGGGGAGWFVGGNGGGGGGYSGGATSGAIPFTGGGGGGSFNNGANQNNAVSTGTGNGSVTITQLACIPSPIAVNFSYTGAVQTWTVPPGVTTVNINAWGAQGGIVFASNANNGGNAQGDLAVTPGETLSIYVGGQGAGLTGGFNGGGGGVNGGGSGGSGGGGASDVRQGGAALADRKIVAGGGGGGGSLFGGNSVIGGPGGGLIGGDGYRDPSYASNPGGQGGNQSASGTGTCVTFNNPAVSGGFGFGGTPVGQGCGCDGFGGGGGWYGGSGSGNCRGGGGGSSYIGGVTAGSTTSGVRAGNGLVTITYQGCAAGDLSGTVTMANAPTTLIPDVVIAAAGATPAVTDGVTNSSGVYSMTGFGPDAYTITPSKTPYPVLAYNGIFSNDATLISRHVVGLNMLSPAQLRAAKVAGLPNLSSYDAALLAQYIVGVTNPINQTGTWKFTPASTSMVVTSGSTLNFAASLMGDVSGDWDPMGARPAARLTDPERIRNAVHASLTPTKASDGSDIVVAFRLDNLRGKQVDSFQFDIDFDPNLFTPAEVAASLEGTLASNMSIAFNSPQKGLLKVVVYGAFPASGDGVYVNLRFRVSGTAVTRFPLGIQNFRINDGEEDVYTVDRRPKTAVANDGTISK